MNELVDMSRFPSLGVGIGYREIYHTEISLTKQPIGFLELIPENFLFSKELAIELASKFHTVLHSVGLSLGSEREESQLKNVADLADAISAHWVSEHASFTRIANLDIGHLTPLPFTEEAIESVVQSAEIVKKAVGRPLLIENISYLFRWPRGRMSESEFLTEVVERSDAGLLLDLENVHNNAINHRYDPYAFIDSLPLDRLGQVHLAGGTWVGGKRFDSHSNPVENDVWKMLRHVKEKTSIPAVSLEWDTDYPSFDIIERELSHARAVLEGNMWD
jgi:uncharacterized protein (UPF0276 family)